MDLLSGGQRQAVYLIMATLAPCEVILLDEHTAALDPIMADIVVELTDKVVREIGLTALMITHSMAQALKYGDRTIMMHRGEIILDLLENEKTNMTVDDLIATFSAKVGGHLDQDNLLLLSRAGSIARHGAIYPSAPPGLLPGGAIFMFLC
ncbi:hypothetical protein JQV27_20050 [Sulfitobacter mediterraneus]|nr:hypothetical protein [Sulfitobacter mediterraneus]MBM1642916.1 hypothetical protein [Sulfitobacter mediterraneus]MBM1646964.1 hypothetical protein [Sulfitobacter mediterraneus]MBM1651006.1 hypothetical protein [Sulfitobacter mediterraneus]MBM1655093.1 hypothetical protein [Sulfitobacter mediterraneus]